MSDDGITFKQAKAIMKTWDTGHFEGKGNGEVRLVME